MTVQDVTKIVLETMAEVVDPKIVDLTKIVPKSNVEKDLGLDSPKGLNFAMAIENRLNIELPATYNPFVDDKTKKFLNIEEIARRLTKHINSDN
ncbi:acyl carrier protein [Leptospira interrogans]|uniref:acyl carrier protein n=1 Tax=Leptospira interrogans TaxID=173 RepID=UPI00178408F6|nr:hypothetical protein [Leptospira interrogans]MBE0305418.1 hypothetical protein [Leptospira interrogans serovar Yeoncheon]